NCPTEGFWGILKAEMFNLYKFTDEASLRASIDKYIHFYNYERLQERFDNHAPMEVRAAAVETDSPAHYPIPENKRILKYKAKFAA
ncbi:IS3 family transposase, partial [Desulfitobacterium chlororespirans]